ncbi:MAG: hypothetical protein ACUVXH_13365 [Anaerolineae bacterium]
MDEDSRVPKRGFDPRRHWAETQRNLILGGFAILLVVGGGLIALLYGPGAAGTAISCLLVFMGIFGLLFLILKAMELWTREDL